MDTKICAKINFMNLDTDNVYHENYRFCQHTMTQIGKFQRNLILSMMGKSRLQMMQEGN